MSTIICGDHLENLTAKGNVGVFLNLVYNLRLARPLVGRLGIALA